MSGSKGRENSSKPQNQKNTSAEGKAGHSGQATHSSPFDEAREIANKYISIFSSTTMDSLHATLVDSAMASGHFEKNAVTLALVERLQDSDPQSRLAAASALLTMKRETDRAAAVLIRILEEADYELRIRALSLLVLLEQVPKLLIPTLIALTNDNDQLLRVGAAAALRDHSKSFTILRDALQAENPGVVMMAASALGRSGKWVGHAVKALLHLLDDTDLPAARAGIVCHLAVMKEHAKEAGPVFFRMLTDPDTAPEVRKSILLALGDMGLGEEAKIFLLNAVRNGDTGTACFAILGLRDLGVVPPEAIQVLTGLLESQSREDRGGAVLMLDFLGAQASEAIPALVKRLMAESEYDFCQHIGNVIQSVGPANLQGSDEFRQHVVTELIDWARQSDRFDLLRVYVSVIASFGKSAIPPLINLALRTDINAGIAMACLGLIGEEAAIVVAETLLSNDASCVREIGAAALGEMGLQAAPAVPALIRLLENGPEEVLPDVIRAIRSIGPVAHEAAPALVSLVLNGNPFLSVKASSALVAIGPGAGKTIYEAIRRTDDNGKKSLKAILDQTGEPYSEPDGIEVVRDQALLIIDSLRTFQIIGQICKDRQGEKFTFTEMRTQLGKKKSSIQDQLDDVSEFFRGYFARFEGCVSLIKDIERGDPTRKVFDRKSGKSPTICQPLGWRAWELTDQFLRKRDGMYVTRRREAREKS